MVVVEQLATELQVELAAEHPDALLDVLRLELDEGVVVEPNGHAYYLTFPDVGSKPFLHRGFILHTVDTSQTTCRYKPHPLHVWADTMDMAAKEQRKRVLPGRGSRGQGPLVKPMDACRALLSQHVFEREP